MKKIISGIAALALAASVFAVDFSANVQVKGDVAGFKFMDTDKGAKSEITLFGFENTEQKDNDLLTVSFAGDRAGANFQFWTKVAEGNPTVRALRVWFQPIEWIKVSIGNVDAGLYTEKVNWWKVPMASNYYQFKDWNGRWSSGSVIDGVGALIELTPIDGLWIAASVAPGAGSSWFTKKTGEDNEADNDAKFLQWGVGAKYQITDLISAGVAFRYIPGSQGAAKKEGEEGYNPWWNSWDNHTTKRMLLTAGVDFGNWSTPYYAFLQARASLEPKDMFVWTGAGYSVISNLESDWTFGGITIDNYVSYNFGFMKLEATIPVTIRLSGEDFDPSYMTARIKATIPFDALSLYCVVGTDEGFNNGPAAGSPGSLAWILNDKFMDKFNIYANVGLNFNVGSANLDCGVEFAYDKAAKTTVIAVPFVAKVAF